MEGEGDYFFFSIIRTNSRKGTVMRRYQLNKDVAVKVAATPANEGIDVTLAIENMTIDQVLVNRYVPSLEEEIVDLQEADQLQAQADADVAETTRVEDVTDVMLNVADTLDTVEEITPQQAMLTDTVSEMAVAGTDGDPDDVIPSAADVTEGKISLESFVEDIRKRAAEIWARIRQFCLEIWNTIKEFFNRIFHAAPRLLARVKELRSAVEAKKKGNLAPTAGFVVPLMGANSVSYPGYMVRNQSELAKGLSQLEGLAKYAYGNYLKDCKSMGEFVAGELKKFDVKNPAEHLKNVAQTVQRNNFTNWPGNPPTGYMGCFDVIPSKLDKNKTKDLSHAQIVSALRSSGMRLQARHGSAALVNTKNQFTTMDFPQMESTLKQVESLVKLIVGFESSADSKSLEKVRQDLISGGDHASAEVGKINVTAGGTDAMSATERQYTMDVMKSLANFNTTLTRWMTELTMPVTKKIYQSCRTSLVLVEKSLGDYKAGAAAPAAAGGGIAS
jgi:hypothetical protein